VTNIIEKQKCTYTTVGTPLSAVGKKSIVHRPIVVLGNLRSENSKVFGLFVKNLCDFHLWSVFAVLA
jgi:hypothetical protein